jgi:ubiquinol-cytochrome c reductase cytochrome b/c1 subunit
MKKSSLAALVAVALAAAFVAPAFAQEHAHETPQPPRLKWSFAGPFGKYDTGQLQRGFKVYKEVCSACHSLSLLSFRNVSDPGGLGYSPAQAAALAAEYKVNDLDESGQPTERAARPADHFPSPFPNEAAAKAANGGVAPPDMSVLAKARTFERGLPWFIFDMFTQYQEQGPDYIAALLKGYKDPPKDFKLPPGGHYNEYFPGHSIAMPPPLQDGQVTFDDGSPATIDQYAKDVSAFLMWAAEPHLVERKRMAFQVMIFLIVLAGLMYFTKKKVWKEAKLYPEETTARPTGPGEYKSH